MDSMANKAQPSKSYLGSWLSSGIDTVKNTAAYVFSNYPLPSALGGVAGVYLTGRAINQSPYKKYILFGMFTTSAFGVFKFYKRYQPYISQVRELWSVYQSMNNNARDGANAVVNKQIFPNNSSNPQYNSSIYSGIITTVTTSMNSTNHKFSQLLDEIFPIKRLRTALAKVNKANGDTSHLLRYIKIFTISRLLVSVYLVSVTRMFLKTTYSLVSRYTTADSTITASNPNAPPNPTEGGQGVSMEERVAGDTFALLEGLSKDVLNVSYNLQVSLALPVLVKVAVEVVTMNMTEYTHSGFGLYEDFMSVGLGDSDNWGEMRSLISEGIVSKTDDGDSNSTTNAKSSTNTNTEWVTHQLTHTSVARMMVQSLVMMHAIMSATHTPSSKIGCEGEDLYEDIIFDILSHKLHFSQYFSLPHSPAAKYPSSFILYRDPVIYPPSTNSTADTEYIGGTCVERVALTPSTLYSAPFHLKCAILTDHELQVLEAGLCVEDVKRSRNIDGDGTGDGDGDIEGDGDGDIEGVIEPVNVNTVKYMIDPTYRYTYYNNNFSGSYQPPKTNTKNNTYTNTNTISHFSNISSNPYDPSTSHYSRPSLLSHLMFPLPIVLHLLCAHANSLPHTDSVLVPDMYKHTTYFLNQEPSNQFQNSTGLSLGFTNSRMLYLIRLKYVLGEMSLLLNSAHFPQLVFYNAKAALLAHLAYPSIHNVLNPNVGRGVMPSSIGEKDSNNNQHILNTIPIFPSPEATLPFFTILNKIAVSFSLLLPSTPDNFPTAPTNSAIYYIETTDCLTDYFSKAIFLPIGAVENNFGIKKTTTPPGLGMGGPGAEGMPGLEGMDMDMLSKLFEGEMGGMGGMGDMDFGGSLKSGGGKDLGSSFGNDMDGLLAEFNKMMGDDSMGGMGGMGMDFGAFGGMGMGGKKKKMTGKKSGKKIGKKKSTTSTASKGLSGETSIPSSHPVGNSVEIEVVECEEEKIIESENV